MADSDLDATDTESPEDASTPSEQLSPDGLRRRIITWWKQDFPHCREWHKQAFDDFKFEAGDQWPEDDRAFMEDAQKRACLEFNQVGPVIDAVTGAEITNRQEVRYIPRQLGAAPVNEVLTEGARWFRDECDAEHEESQAFRDATTCGMGWTETRLDYEMNPQGDPKIERVDPIEMVWDYAAKKANLLDARRIMRVVRNIPLTSAKDKWKETVDGKPIEDDSTYDATWAAPGSDEETPYNVHFPGEPLEHEGDEPREDDMVTVVQVQWFEQETFYHSMMVDPKTNQQSIQQLSEQEHQIAGRRAEELGQLYRGVRQTRRVYYKAYVGAEVLELVKLIGPSGTPAKSFTMHCFTAKYDRNKGHFYGLVRPMRGPQTFANKWLSTAVEIMARGAKGGLMMEEGAVEDVNEFEDMWSTPGANAYFTPGALAGGKVQPKPDVQFPQDFMSMTQFAVASIRDVTGVNVQALPLGSAPDSNPDTASQEYSRRQTATIILAPLFDALRRYRREQGRLLLWMITEFLSDGRLVRIVGQEGEQYVQLIHQPGTLEFDVIVDDAPNSPNQKELVWSSLVTMMPLIQAIQPPPGVIMALLEYSPLPASVVAKIKAAVGQAQQQQQGQPSPMDLIMMEKKADIDNEQKKNQIRLQSKVQENQLELIHSQKMAQIEVQKAIAMARVATKAKQYQAAADAAGQPEGGGDPIHLAIADGLAKGAGAGMQRVATEVFAGNFAKEMGLPVGPATHVSNAAGVTEPPPPPKPNGGGSAVQESRA